MASIVEQIGVPALLEQTAEDCCELAQACLKMARKLRDENPTPKSIEDIRDNLVEEMADVRLCIGMINHDEDLMQMKDIDAFHHLIDLECEKRERWEKRLGLSIDLEDENESV